MAFITIKLQKGYSKLFKIKHIPILQTDYIDGKKTFKIPLFSKFKTQNKPVFYLKISKKQDYFYVIFQHWINIINELNADFYIVCDDIKLENRLLRRLVFKDSNIKFIRSQRTSKLEQIVKHIATPLWRKATFAHLTTFWHAKKYGIKEFWNIDADDTMLCLKPSECAKLIEEVQDYARKNDISVFSYDMWKSRTKGKHWSFGISFIRQNVDYFKYFRQNKDFCWIEKYKEFDNNWNLDWFFNYLKDSKNIKIESFYIDNLMFFHVGDMLFNIIGSSVYLWHDGFVEFPILKHVYGDSILSKFPVSKDVVKFDTKMQLKHSQNYALKEISCIYLFSKETRALHSVPEDFCNFIYD